MIRYAVYADFNCPFCDALSERLQKYAGHYEIEWRPIQHVASPISRCSVEDLSVLASEVFTVRHRAPEVTIAMPQTRPVSREATRIFTALQTRDPDQARRFRAQIYRALWVEDRDISDPQILATILGELGIDAVPTDPAEAETTARWQQAWETAGFERRIPTMTASDGRVLSGLACPTDIESFLEGRPAEGEPSGVCEFVPRPVILVVGEPRDIWRQLAPLKWVNDVLIAGDGPGAVAQLADGVAPDLLIVPAGFGPDGLETRERCNPVS